MSKNGKTDGKKFEELVNMTGKQLKEHFQRFEKLSDDPWIHRSSMMKCSSCMWYVQKVKTENACKNQNNVLGRCRKHAPTMNGFPAVFPNDWCGDHKLDENKI